MSVQCEQAGDLPRVPPRPAPAPVSQSDCTQAFGDMARQAVRKLIQLLAGSNIPHNDGTVVTGRGHPATPNE